MRGRFIVCEGTDGSGKGTQARLLMHRLIREARKKVLFMDFPQYDETFSGKLVGRFLKGEFGGIKEVDPHLASLPYAMDRWEGTPKINRALAEGTWVISSRYALSNMAHQTAKLPEEKRENFMKYLEELEYGLFGIAREDRYFYLYVPADIGQKLVDQKGERGYVGGNHRDIHEADLGHQLSAAGMYQRLAQRFDHVTTVNCCDHEGKLLNQDVISDMVWQELVKLYGPEINEGRIRKERE